MDTIPSSAVPAAPRPTMRSAWTSHARRAAWFSAIAAGLALLLLVTYLLALVPLTPSVKELRALQVAKPSVLMSADGQTLATFRRANQERVPLSRVSLHVTQALIATEDRRFRDHHGVDVLRTLGAAWYSLTGDLQGGSTITQQLARNLFPEEIGRARTLNRKLKEVITALRIERVYSKEQILETYLNTAPFLYNVVGIEMAARTYFDKSAAELDALESATLIGMLKGTRYYNPVLYPERAQKRRNVVLAQMAKNAWLTDAQLRDLRARPLRMRFNRQSEDLGTAPHFAAHARRWLIAWADENDYNLYTDGLVVQTTLDSRLQDAAARAVQRQALALQQIADVEWATAAMKVQSGSPEPYAKLHPKVDPFAHWWVKRRDLVSVFMRETPEFKKAVAAGASDDAALSTLAADKNFVARLKRDKTRLEAGFLAIDPANGEVKAWVGSRDFEQEQFDHVAQAERQPGSTFKPIVYGAALESGLGPDRSYLDGAVEVALGDGKIWRPTDMSGASGLPMTLRDGLVYSKNTITVQVAQEVGVSRIVKLAQAMGVDQSKLDPVPSLALGTSPVTLLEMVNAYATIARLGQHHEPLLIRRITDRRGHVLADFGAQTRNAMSADSAVELIDMMRGVVARGTGTGVKRFGLVADIAGKTGTTQNNTDGWFILMHPKLVAGAWVGFNDSRVTMRSDHWGQGGHNAILLVGDFFRDTLKHKLIDVKATFPPSRRPPPPVEPPMPADWSTQIEGMLQVDPPAASAAVVVSPQGSAPLSADRAGSAVMTRDDAPKSAADLERVMIGMGRDPVTGTPRAPAPASSRVPDVAPTPETPKE